MLRGLYKIISTTSPRKQRCIYTRFLEQVICIHTYGNRRAQIVLHAKALSSTSAISVSIIKADLSINALNPLPSEGNDAMNSHSLTPTPPSNPCTQPLYRLRSQTTGLTMKP